MKTQNEGKAHSGLRKCHFQFEICTGKMKVDFLLNSRIFLSWEEVGYRSLGT